MLEIEEKFERKFVIWFEKMVGPVKFTLLAGAPLGLRLYAVQAVDSLESPTHGHLSWVNKFEFD